VSAPKSHYGVQLSEMTIHLLHPEGMQRSVATRITPTCYRISERCDHIVCEKQLWPE